MKSISHAKTQRRNEGRKERRKDQSPSLRLSLRLCAFARPFFCGVVLVFLACLASTAQIVDTRGLAELKKGDYDNAFKLLNTRLASDPNDVPAQRALLRVYIETGRYAEAEAAAKKFLAKTPETAAGIPKRLPSLNVLLLTLKRRTARLGINSPAIYVALNCSN